MYALLCANLLTASTISISRENCSHKAPCIEYHAFMASVKSIFNFFLHKANFFLNFATLVIEVIILLLIFLIAFFIGASLASFAGCVAWRFANNVPQTIPRSFCENCRHELCFWQLIPVVGYLLQGGRCAFCKHKIPGHETLIEIVFGLFCGKIFLLHPDSPNLLTLFLSAWLLFLAWTDALKFCVPAASLYGGGALLLLCRIDALAQRNAIDWCFLLLLFCLMKLFEQKQMFGAADTFVCLILSVLFGIQNFCFLLFLSCCLIILHYAFFHQKMLPFIPFILCSYLFFGCFFPQVINV